MKFLRKLPSPASRYAQAGRVSLPLAAAAVLGLALVLRIGLPLWSALPGAPQDAGSDPSGAPALGPRGPDVSALRSLQLFDGTGGPVLDTPPALNTALNLHLEGVILSGTEANSMAVIVSGSERGTYRTGDSLPAGANVRIAGIARDHVVIDNRGQREVLWLFGAGQAQRPAGATAVASGNGAAGLALPPGTDQRVLQTAARLAEIIAVTPEQYNGALIGYRLTPGARLKEFMQLGFETNDIVTAVDGIALNDVTNLPKLYSLMDGATEVSFSLLRNGTPLNLKVTLSPETGANSR